MKEYWKETSGMKPMPLALLLALAASLPAQAQDTADAVARMVVEARGICASENGVFNADGAVTEIDLTGDGAPDALVDESLFACSPGASPYCGSGGCTLHAVIDGKSFTFQAEGWRMIDWGGRPILLIARDGGWCGGAGAQGCFEAVVWSHGDMLTVMPPVE